MYPDYPKNRLIVNNIDLSTEFKMVLADGYTNDPPSPKTYTVDIPGLNGVLDLTESLYGDVAYGTRNQSFTFYIIDVNNYEQIRSDVYNFLHGKSFDYQMTMDPGYTYHGRFSVSGFKKDIYNSNTVYSFTVSVVADPYKYKEDVTRTLDGIGGKVYVFIGGRYRSLPKFEFNSKARVIFKGKQYDMPIGTYTINDLYFEHGQNELYINTFDIHNFKWGDFIKRDDEESIIPEESVTWRQFNTLPLYKWYKRNGDNTAYVLQTWTDLQNAFWRNMENTTWSDLQYSVSADEYANIQSSYINYRIGDL